MLGTDRDAAHIRTGFGMIKNFTEDFKQFAFRVEFVAVLFLLLLLAISYRMYDIQRNVEKAQANAQHSKELASELFQSSEDLTRMARSYVVTGSPAYKKRFESVLKIRNGQARRPESYSPTYWHLNEENDAIADSNRQSSAIPLRTLMIRAEFTAEEIALLDESKNTSDRLALVEQKAFQIVDDLVENNENAIAESPYAKEALRLLYNDEYMRTKRAIMAPIEAVMLSVERRTSQRLRDLQVDLMRYMLALGVLIPSGLVGVVVVFFYTSRRFVSPLSRLSDTDALTGILNRRGFEFLAKREFERSLRTERSLSLMMIDIDHFKKVNDSHGHAVGDGVLTQLSKLLQNNLRKTDILGRWGGEEFVVLFPELEEREAFEKAEKLRKLIENTPIRISPQLTLEITVSMGLSAYDKNAKDLDAIIHLADEQLYRAKEGGRNRVCSRARNPR